ncbi:hypothetical protein RhiirA1_417785 [Rhizophagus irregularis]|uniref:F-box domain-containing protein n=1 Tax=Rhizophagus irregularis TaxID=588596 RepID=A0A2N0RWL8_9GLOM|nr:hypothetical protein RhiirA1_417785 [Rhizophagus irregularis]
MSSYLLFEILENIFDLLKNDMGTLFSCMLVKRSWCRIIVPILWGNSFKYVKGENTRKLIVLYLKFLPSEMGTHYLEDRMLLKDGRNLLSFIGGESNFMFDYPIYLKELDCSHISQIIDEWSYLIVSQENISYPHQRGFCSKWFSNKLIRLFMKKSVMIRTMISNSDEYHFNEVFAFNNGGEIGGFKFLQTLHLDYCCDGHSLRNITDVCHSIEELWISLTETSVNIDTLNKLILSQRRLKDFRLRSAVFVMEYFFGISYDLLEALMVQKGTLHTVQFFCCQFFKCESLKPLAECTNIKRLGFFNCEGLCEEKIEPLASGSFSNLQILAMAVYKGFSTDVIVNMVKNSQENLKRISLPMATPNNHMIKVFCDMIPYTKNLIGITVCFIAGDNKSFESFLSLLDACPNLEYLCIEGGDTEGIPLDFDDDDMIIEFKKLIKIMPQSVYRLIFYNISISSILLQTFFDNCVAKIKYLGFYECPLLIDEHNNIITEYVKKSDGELKNLIINWCYLVSYYAINNARKVIENVQFSDVEPQDMEFTAWLE